MGSGAAPGGGGGTRRRGEQGGGGPVAAGAAQPPVPPGPGGLPSAVRTRITPARKEATRVFGSANAYVADCEFLAASSSCIKEGLARPCRGIPRAPCIAGRPPRAAGAYLVHRGRWPCRVSLPVPLKQPLRRLQPRRRRRRDGRRRRPNLHSAQWRRIPPQRTRSCPHHVPIMSPSCPHHVPRHILP